MCCSPTKSKFTLCSCCCCCWCCCCSCCVKQNSCRIIHLASYCCSMFCIVLGLYRTKGDFLFYCSCTCFVWHNYAILFFHLTTLGLCLNYAFYFHYYNLILYFKYKLIPIVQFYQFYAAFSFFSFTLKSKRQLE